MNSIALYSGSFDPLTVGHVDIVQRALHIFDRLVIVLAINASKTPTFSTEERLEMLRETFADEPRVEITVSKSGLLVDEARRRGIRTVVRGLRAVSDFDYEFQLASMNRRLTDEVDFMFLMTSEEHFYISSSSVKAVASAGGSIVYLVPPPVARRLAARFGESILSVTKTKRD